MNNLMSSRIYAQRKKLQLTMEELGNKVGVSKSTVNKWEKGQIQNIKRSTIRILSDVLECDPVWLMGLDDPDETSGFNDAEILKKIHRLNEHDFDIVMKLIDSLLGQ